MQNKNAKLASLEEANKLLIDISAGEKTIAELVKSKKGLDGFTKETKKIAQGFTSIGRSNYVAGVIPTAKIEKIIGPVETSQGYAILQIHEKSKLDSTLYEQQKDQIRKEIFSKKQNQYFQAWVDDLKEKAEIIDNRKYYF